MRLLVRGLKLRSVSILNVEGRGTHSSKPQGRGEGEGGGPGRYRRRHLVVSEKQKF
jgi:hypothetical protein